MDYTLEPPDAPKSKYTLEPPPKPQSKYKLELPGEKPTVSRETVGSNLRKEGEALGQSFLDVPREAIKQNQEAAEAFRRDFTDPIHGREIKNIKGLVSGQPQYEKPGMFDYAGRGLRTAADAANWLSGMGYATGALTSLVGRPVEAVTGIPKRETGDVLSYAVPFAGDIKAGITGVKAADGIKAVEKVLSPTTVSPEAGKAERIVRRARGESTLEAQKAAATLVSHNKLVGNLPVPLQRALVGYIEGRSKGMKIPRPDLQNAADAIRDVYGRYKARIEKVLPKEDVPKFITDYYTHMWKEKPSIVAQKLGSYYRQGSGRSFKARKIPTIEDGINAGLTPVTENPIETTMTYAQNMSRFIATHDIQNELKAQGYTKWFQPGSKNIPRGWVPLDGIRTEKAIAFKGKPTAEGVAGQPVGRTIKLYAPEDVARVYNNFISRGLEGTQVGPFFTAARKVANGLAMLKLGLSPYHLDTMANEGMASAFARGYAALSRGELKIAGKAFGGAVAAPITSMRRGLKMQRELLDKAMPDSLSKKVNDAFVRSGGIPAGMDPFYRARASGSFFNAMERGTFKRELMQAFDRIYRGSPWEKAKGTVDLGANVVQSMAAPLFEKYIPAVKRGAFASRMEDFLKSNPGATQEEIDKFAVKLQDSIDNRFGELVQDNLFWHRWMKQMAQITLLSATWDLGTVREIGGGLKDALHAPADIIKGKGISDRTAYVLGLATQVALKNALYTYLKTGQTPRGKDFMAGRTGGTDASTGEPERVITPGYEKDVYAFGYDFPHNVLNESYNKLSPWLTGTLGLIQNKDYRGLPILKPEGAPDIPGQPTLMDFLSDQLMPISLGQFKQGRKVGSKISPVEGALGVRPAPRYVTAPTEMEQMRVRQGTKAWQQRVRSDERQQSLEEQ